MHALKNIFKEILMRNKKNIHMLSLLLIALIVFNYTTASAATDTNYSIDNAANYAEKWALGYNTSQYYKADYDCTNYVSQCLAAGGKKISSTLPSYTNTNYWRPHSATWENANYFKKYWKNNVESIGKDISSFSSDKKYSYATTIYNAIYRGDVVQYGYDSDDMKHSQICYAYGKSSTGYSTLIMAQHTINKKDIALHDYIQQTGYTYIRYYNMKNKL